MAIPIGVPEQVETFSLKEGVSIKINGVEYTTASGVPQGIAIKFIALNFLRYNLFEEIEDIDVHVRKFKEQHDIQPIDIEDKNDTDIFIFGNAKKLPIKVAGVILETFIGVEVVNTSKAIIQQMLQLASNNYYGEFRQYAEEWFGNGTVHHIRVSEDGVIDWGSAEGISFIEKSNQSAESKAKRNAEIAQK